MTDRTDIDTTALRARLLARRDEILRFDASEADERKTVELDPQRLGRLSRMDALQGQAMAQETERRRHLEIRKIDAALARLEAGEFGYCATCGDEIPAKRLAFDPAASLCVDCAQNTGKP
jgi:DnaK suppressor protein